MSAAISFDEIAARCRTAARAETFGLNQLELLVAKSESQALRELTIGETLRQAEALAKASEIALALARNPDIAIGLGFAIQAGTPS